MTDNSERSMAMICHLAFLITFFGSNLLAIIVLLVIWLMHKNDSPFVDRHGREALNLQITIFGISILIGIFMAIWAVLIMIPASEADHANIIGIFAAMWLPLLFLGLLFLVYAVLSIIAAIRARDGEDYQYPFVLRLL